MPQFEVTIDGRTFDVEAGDQQQAYESVAGMLAQQEQSDRAAGASAASDMNWGERALASFGGGMKQALGGLGQVFLPESAEKALGIDDATLASEEAMRQELMDRTGGGQLLGLAGEIVPAVGVIRKSKPASSFFACCR